MAYSLTSLVDKVRQTLTGAVAQAPTTLSNIGNRVVGGYNEVAKALPLVPTTGEVRAFGLNPLRFMLDPRYNNGNNFSSSAPMKMASAFQGAIEQGAKAPGYLPSYFPKAIVSAGQSIKTYMDPAQTPTLLSKQGLSNYVGAVAKTASPVLDVALLPKTPAKVLLGSSVLGGGISGLLGAGQRLASGGSPGSAVSGLGSDLIQGAQQSLLQAPKISAIGSITNPAISKYAGQILAKFPQLSQSGANIINRILQGTMSVPEGYIMAKATGTDYNLTSAAIDFAVGSGLAKKAGEITQNKTKEISKMFPSETRAQALRRKAGFAGIRMKPNEGDHILYLIENELGKVNNEKNNRNFVLDTGALITMRDKLIRGTETPEDIRTAKDIFRRSGVDITPPKPFVVSGSGGYVDIGTTQLTGRQLDMTNEQLAKAQVPVQKLQQQGRQIQMMEPLARGARQMAKAEAEVKAGVIGDELNTQDRTKLGQLKLVFQRADQNEGAWDVKSLSKNNKTLITWATERWREIYPYKANMTDDELINDIYSFVKDNQLSKKPKLDTPGIVKTMQQAREDQKTLARLSEYGEDQFPVRKGQPMTIADSEAQQKMIEQRLTKSGARDATLDELEAILNTPDNQLKGGYALEEGPGIAANAKGTGDDPQTFRGIINKFLGGKENIKLSQYEQVKPIADVKFTDEGAKQAIKAIETGDTDGLAPQIKEYVSTLRKSFDKIRSEAVADGLPIGYIDNYLTHYWEQPPDQVQAVINGLRKSGAFQKERVFLTYEEGINAGLTPRFKNPTQILGHYVRQVENIRNNLKLVKQLESNGYIISGDERKLVQGVREIAIPGFSGKFAKPEVARVIEGLFEPKEADKIIGRLAKISGKIQDVTLSGGIPGTPFNAFSVAGNLQKQFLSGRFSGPLKSFARAFSPGETTKYFQENIPVIREIQGAGYSLPTTLNYSKLIGDEAGGISKVWDATVSDPTFKRFIPMMQIDLYKEVKDKALKAGLSNDQALEKALAVLKNFEGMSDMYSRATQDPNARAVTQALFFAPKFRQAILGIWASSIKALKNPSALENQYNARFLAGSVLTYAAMNAANAYFNNGKMMWENGKNKEDKLIIPDGQGGEIGVPFLSSLGTIPRGIARQGMKILKGDISGAATDAGQTYLSSGIKPIADVMANQDYFGKKIVQPDSKSKWGDILSYLGRSYLSHPYIKELFDPRNTSDPGYQRLSRSMELPFRFYDKKSVDSSKYFEARDKALESLSEIEKKAYDAVPKYDEKNPDSQIFKYQTFLTYPNVFEAKRMTEFNLAKQTGKAIDPLYLVNYDTAKAYMRYETLPPGSQDRKDLLKIKPELAALFDVRSKYFKENPMEGQAKSSRPLPSEYIQQQMDAKNWSDPQVRAYLDANTQYQNEQRAKLGLAPLAGFTQFAKKPKRVSVKLAKVNAPKIKLPKTKLPRIKMTKPLRLGKIRVRLK